ncbi:FtsX-like permease family protein [Eisenbergiella sp.]
MNDILFSTNNKSMIKKLANRRFNADIRQNKVMITAISLVTFMMLTIFSLGFSFFQNYKTMDVRVTGTKANGLITNLTQQQVRSLKQLDYVSGVGSQVYAGSVNIGDSLCSLTGYDAVEWKENIEPTVDRVTGTFPAREKEIMLSEKALQLLGIENPSVGMEIKLLPSDTAGTEHIFYLSGWYRDFLAISRPAGSISGNVAAAGLSGIQPDCNAIVSQAYAKEHALLCLTTFRTNTQDPETERKLRADLMPEANQDILLINFKSGSSSNGLYGVIAAVLGSLFVMVCGYLLIYNIAYISITKDIHFYGVLKTLGTTTAQIKKIVRKQIIRLSAIAIPIGLVLGSVVSIWVVPFVLGSLLSGGGLNAAMERKASFHPFIFFFAAAFSFVTVTLSCLKPAKKAGMVSPIMAVRFAGTDEMISKKFTAKGKHGTKLWQMAYRNVFRDKKKAVLVFLSLFMGLTMFLLVYTVFSKPDWNYSAVMEAPYDFSLSDETIKDITDPKEAQFNDAFLEKLGQIEGIEEKEIICGVAAQLNSGEKVLEPYLADKLKVSSVEKSDLLLSPRADTSGISSSLLQTLPLADGGYTEAALADFEAGNTVYLTPTETGQVPENIVGETISIQNPATGESADYTIAGILKPLTMKEWQEGQNFYHNIGRIRDNQAVSAYGKHRIASVYMSVTGIKRIAPQPVVSWILLNAADGAQDAVRQKLTEMQAGNADIYMLAQSAYIETNKTSLGSIMIIGTVFSVLLLLIGLMNFVNTITTNIYSRRKELATLESIGMTKKQIMKTLTLEGMYYAIFSLVLVTVIGIPLTYGFIQMTRETFYFLTFKPPVFAVSLMSLLVMMICFFIPRRTYREISKDSVTERLRLAE